MKNLIVVLMGGISGERKISFLSGKSCSKALIKKGYKVKEIDAKGSFVDKFEEFQYLLFLIKSTVFFVLPTSFTI